MESLPLSLSQKEIWLEHLTWPSSNHLNIGVCLTINGQIDELHLKQAIDLLVEYNDALSLNIVDFNNQIYKDDLSPNLKVLTLDENSIPESRALDWADNWAALPFDNVKQPPLEFVLLQGDNLTYLALKCFHSLLDGWSVADCMRKLAVIYTSVENSESASLKNVIPPYRDFIEDSETYANGMQYQRDKDFWCNYLDSSFERLFSEKFISDSEPPKAHINRYNWEQSHCQQIDKELTQLNKSKANYMLALVASYFLKAYRKQAVVIGVPVLNRSGKKYKSTLGTCVGVIPVKIEMSPSDTFSQLVDKISKQLKQMYRHARFPLSHTYRALNLTSSKQERLFDIIFSFEDFELLTDWGAHKSLDAKQLFSSFIRTPIALSFCDFTTLDNQQMVIEANEKFFSKDEAVQINQRIFELSKLITSNLNKPLQEILLPEFNLPDKIKVVEHLQEEQNTLFEALFLSEEFNNNPALIWNNGCLSHQEMLMASIGLAQRLKKEGCGVGDIVAMRMSKGPDSIITMLAVVQIGACFLPIDPYLPSDRLQQILLQSKFSILVTNIRNDGFAFEGALSIYTDVEELKDNSKPLDTLELNIDANSNAYVLFTSGSTGAPKGVAVNHKALTLRINAIADEWNVTSEDISLQATQFHFDPALIEVLLPLSKGGAISFPEQNRPLAADVLKCINQYSVSIIAFVPSTLQQLTAEIAKSDNKTTLRVCCCGGEVLSKSIAEYFLTNTNATLYNVYGPTEAIIFATAWKVEPSAMEKFYALPVGKSLADTKIHILDSTLHAVPSGVEGEIYISGNTLSDGYLNNADITDSSFIRLPQIVDSKIYKTGDIGWVDSEGTLHFKERLDRQIKLRGYRVELSDIESNLTSMENVNEAAVKLVDDSGKPELEAWVVLRSESMVTTLRQTLAKRLPDYMLPAKFHVLNELPRTVNGKIDYSGLERVNQSRKMSFKSKGPQNEIEMKLLSLWRDALKKPKLKVDDDFFENGADSLTAVTLLTKIENLFNLTLPLHAIIESSSVAALSSTLVNELGLNSTMVRLNKTKGTTSLYIAASGHGDALRFQSLAKEMATHCNLFMLQPPKGSHSYTMAELAKIYAGQIISTYNGNDIYVGGFSVGGVVALETTKLIEANNINVRELLIVDTVLLKMPFLGLLVWRVLPVLFRTFPKLATSVFTSKFISVILDRGLFMQVKAMRQHKLKSYNGNVTLLKSSGYKWLQKIFFRGWRKLSKKSLVEYEIQTTHSRFFESTTVIELANILKTRIKQGK